MSSLVTRSPDERSIEKETDIFCTEPVFLNVYGAPESILRNEFRQPM
jgi:hypothetical protein